MQKVKIGDCTLYQGDCLEILPELEAVDMIITDPPYGTQDLGGGYGRRQLHSKDGRDGRKIQNDFDLSCFKSAFELFPITEGYAMVFFGARRMKEFVNAIGDADLIGSIVWNKKQMGLGYTIRYAHEDIAVIKYGNNPRPDFPLESVITCHQREKLHPHQKPVELMRRLVSWRAGMVLDPFMGSGTTGVACAELSNPFIGIELETEYFDLACQRIEQAYNQPSLFEQPPEMVTQEVLL